MPRTLLTAQTPKGPYPGTVTANLLDYTYTAGDLANGNYFVGTGRELLLWRNIDVGTTTITIHTVADHMGRTATITAYALQSGDFGFFWFGDLRGYDQGGGAIWIDVSDIDIHLAVVRIP